MLNMKPSIKNSQTKRPQSTFQLMMRVAMWCAISLGGIATNAYALSPDQIFNKVKDSIVVVKVFDENIEQLAFGSGVVLSPLNIGTNCHVVEGARYILVQNGKQSSLAYLAAGDESLDICVIQPANPIGIPAVVGNTTKLRIGERVYAVGAPEGLELTFSEGLVSGIRDMLIQTSAPISSGSSGGGLFDTNGRLLGFTTLMHKRGQNLNFAVPVEWVAYAKPIVNSEASSPAAIVGPPEIGPAPAGPAPASPAPASNNTFVLEPIDIISDQSVSMVLTDDENNKRIDYIERIKIKILGLIRFPPKLAGKSPPQSVFRVYVADNGTVTKTRLLKSSGINAYDQAMERAIISASPLPLPPGKNSMVFIDGIILNFRQTQ
ncbi:MAG: trypsin-like peptidase domain-containing protein [Hydrogenophilales bacterium]|nr:trypsin-like peptidase domain-containing protein [Hydrogenophilales bacterium]